MNMKMKSLLAVTLAVLVTSFFLPQPSPAKEMHGMGKMDNNMQVHHKHIMTMKRIFKFERNLSKVEAIRIVYLYKKGNETSAKDKDAMMMMAKGMTTDGVDGKTVSFTPIDIGSSEDFTSNMERGSFNVIYLGSGLLKNELETIGKYGVSSRTLVIGSDKHHAEGGHTSVGIVVGDKRVSLVINLKTAKKVGADFDPRLLRLADKVIR